MAAKSMESAQAIAATAKPGRWRLAGGEGVLAVVGEVSDIRDGKAVWVLNPSYAAWFWPLMLKATALALLVPEALLEPAQEGDLVTAPRLPTEVEKTAILKTPESASDAIQVHTLVLKGKQPSVHRAFPTRMINLAALRYCRARIASDAQNPQAAVQA
ncbi:MAG TPA: hypothetical protein VGH81_01750 [Rudaea sp.]